MLILNKKELFIKLLKSYYIEKVLERKDGEFWKIPNKWQSLLDKIVNFCFEKDINTVIKFKTFIDAQFGLKKDQCLTFFGIPYPPLTTFYNKNSFGRYMKEVNLRFSTVANIKKKLSILDIIKQEYENLEFKKQGYIDVKKLLLRIMNGTISGWTVAYLMHKFKLVPDVCTELSQFHMLCNNTSLHAHFIEVEKLLKMGELS